MPEDSNLDALEMVMRKMGHEPLPSEVMVRSGRTWQMTDGYECAECGYVRGRMRAPDENLIPPCMMEVGRAA
jgi:hypothetical protein